MDPYFREAVASTAAAVYLLGAALAFVCSSLPGAIGRRLGHAAAVIGSVLTCTVGVWALVTGEPVSLAVPGVLPQFGDYAFHLDPLSALFVALIAGVSVPAAVWVGGDHERSEQQAAVLAGMLNLFVLGMAAVVAAENVFTFLVAWELMSLASYFLANADYHQREVRRAGYVYLVMTHLGTLLIIAAFLLLARSGGGLEWAHLRAGAAALSPAARSLIFILALIGFGTKAGLIPVHIWLPLAHPVAPGHISALMSGAMVKTAIYGLLRFGFDLLGGGPPWWGGALLAVGAVSALFGVLYACVEGHLKRLLAFSTVENVGLITMGVGAALWARALGQPSLAGLALIASLYHAVNHAAIKGLLFLGAGTVHHATGTLNLEEMGGLNRRLPHTARWFLVGALAMAALPPLNGLISEWLLLQSFLGLSLTFPASGAGAAGLLAAAALALTGALVAVTMIKAYGVTFLGLPRSEGAAAAREAPWPMRAAMALLTLVCIFLSLGAGAVVPVLGTVAASLTGSAAGVTPAGWWSGINLTGGGFAAVSLAPASLLGALLVLAGLGWVLTRRYGRLRWRVGPTWTCGILPEARMQYSAAGYTSPLRLMFRRVLWAGREVRVRSGEPDLFPGVVEYSGVIRPVYETYLYAPVVRLVLGVARRLRRLQMGDTLIYLWYLFSTLLLLLVLGR